MSDTETLFEILTSNNFNIEIQYQACKLIDSFYYTLDIVFQKSIELHFPICKYQHGDKSRLMDV